MSGNGCGASQDNKESSSGSEYQESELENDASSDGNADAPNCCQRKGIDPDNDILYNGDDALVERSAKAKQTKDSDGLTDSVLQKSKQPYKERSACVKDLEGNNVALLLHFYQSGWTPKRKECKVLLQPGKVRMDALPQQNGKHQKMCIGMLLGRQWISMACVEQPSPNKPKAANKK
eukprot:8720504-Ditylum_brightwellii.AAC.1